MRLLTVSHFYASHGGGIERVAGNLCREFAKLGVTPVWAASDRDAPPTDDAVPVPLHCFDPTERLTGLPMPIPGWRAIRTLAREIERCDAVIIHDALYVSSILAMLIARRKRKRTVLIQHIAAIPFPSLLLRGLMRLANSLVTRPMLRATGHLVFISDTVRRDLLGEPPWRDFQLLFNGVDTEIFHRVECPDTPLDDAAPWPSGKTRVLFVGRYVGKKGMAVIRELARRRQDLGFVLAGSGPLQPAEWHQANVLDVGIKSQRELAKLFRHADVLLLPSVGEGYPLVIQEAMASGLPVICGQPADCADPHASRWIEGVPIDLSDPSGSALRCGNAIDRARISEAERAEMAAYAMSTYRWTEMAKAVIACARGADVKG